MDKNFELFIRVIRVLFFSLLLSLIAGIYVGAPARAASFNCGTSGTYEVNASNVLTGHTNCVGDLIISNSVTSIGTKAFFSNVSLGSIVIPSSVTTIGDAAFKGSKFTSLTLNEGLTTISGNYAFGEVVNSARLNIYLPDSLTSIGLYTFANSNFSSISIGQNISSLAISAFYNNGATGFESIVFRGNPPLTSLKEATAAGYRGTEFIIPSNVTTIEARVFELSRQIRYLEIPSKVTSIGSKAFYSMDNLGIITLPNSLTTLASDAFLSTPKLNTIIYCGQNFTNYVWPNSIIPVCERAVLFDKNGGMSGTMATQRATSVENLSSNSFTRSYFTFKGWNTKANGTGTPYADGAPYDFSSSVVLYAQWAVDLTNFPSITKSFGAAPFVLSNPLSHPVGGSFTYTSSDTAVATISGSTVTVRGSGTSVITANFTPSDLASYRTSSTTATLTVSAATQAITVASTKSTLTKSGTADLTATGFFGTGTIAYSVVSGSCSITDSTLTAMGSSGSCVIAASIASDGTYPAATSASISITLVKGTPALSSFSLPARNFGASPTAITPPTVSGSIPGSFSYSSSNTSVATISGSTVNAAGAGSSVITATFTPTDIENFAVVTIQSTLVVGSTTQSISITSVSPRIVSVNDNDYRPTATAPGGPVTIALATSSLGCSLSSGVVSFNSAGTCLINFSQVGNANYSAAPQLQESISIGKGLAKVPTFGIATRTADGFTLEISNYDGAFVWAGVSSAGGTVNITPVTATTGLITVSNLGQDVGSSVTISTQRSQYDNGSSTSSTIFSLGLAGAPTSLAAVSASAAVTLSWIAPSSNGGSAIIDFSVQYSADSGANWITFTHAASPNTSIVVNSLTNGTPYTFRVAAISAAGTSAYSTTTTATPLGTRLVPTLDTAVPTADGFTINVTNYDASFGWESSAVTVGQGVLSSGTSVGAVLPLRVTGMSPGSSSTVTVSTTKSDFANGSTVVSASSLNAVLLPVINDVVVTTSGLSAKISNFSSAYQWTATTSSGQIEINSLGTISLLNVLPSTSVTIRISNSRAGYAPGSETATATTLPLLRILYDGNSHMGGSVPDDSLQYRSNEVASILGNSGSLSKPGYTFAGWNLNAENTGQSFEAASTFTLSFVSITFYAKWNPIPYSINYQSANITSGSAPLDQNISGNQNFYTIGQSAPILGNTRNLTRVGYTFAGWRDNSSGTGTVYVSGNSYLIQSSNVNLWAEWSPNTYTVTYNKNGATGEPSKATDTYTTASDAITLATRATMGKRGHTFSGWSLSTDGALLSDSLTVTSNVTLYAKWSIDNYSVSYALNGGAGTAPTQANVNHLDTFTIASATGLTKVVGADTYAFVAWSDNTATFFPGLSYRIDASPVVLTAIWTRIYNVNYTLNGGSVATAIPDVQKILGETITVTSVMPERPGYRFVNWIDQGGRTSDADDSYLVGDEHFSLSAQWAPIPNTVLYDVAGGATQPTETNKIIGQSFVLALAPTKSGFTFAGWHDGTSIYPAGASYIAGAANVVLVAQWTPESYEISFDFNGGVGTPIAPQSYIYGTSGALLPTTGPSRTDFNFGGWSTSANGADVGTTFAPSGSILLRAVWNPSVYFLSFNAGLGFSDTSTAKVSITQALRLPSATRANYTLLGWSQQPSGGSILPAGSEFTPTADGVLFAQWSLQVFVLTYNGNNGTASQQSASVIYGASTGITLATATRDNYIFDGWYSAPEGGYLIGTANSMFMPTTSLTAYAHWIQTSLYGMGAATKIAEVTVSAGNGYSFTAGSNGSSVAITYIADSLLPGTKISAYIPNSTSRAFSLLNPSYNYILSIVLAWVAPDGTVPSTVVGKPIMMTISNPGIKSGAKVYRLLGDDTPRYLGTAISDGTVSVAISDDPEIVIVIATPDAPTSVEGSSSELSSVLVSWITPIGTGGSEIIGYKASSNSGQFCETTTTSCRIAGLSPSTSYTFTVTATNARGAGAASAPSPAISTASPASSGFTGSAPQSSEPSAGNSASENTGSSQSSAATAAAAVAERVLAEQKAREVLAAKDLAEKVAAEAKELAEKQAAEAKELAEKQAAEALAEKIAAEALATKARADKEAYEAAQIAEEEKLARLQAAAERKALADAALAAKKIIPAVTLYSVGKTLKLSTFDTAYLKKYVSTLKKYAYVTCVGYIYDKKTTKASAKSLAQKQASAVCALMKKSKPTLKTSILLLPAASAPKAAIGSKWVSVRFRIDGYQAKR